MAGRSLTELFPVTEETEFAPEFFNNLIAEISLRISALQMLRDGLEIALARVEGIALDRINLVLVPAMDEVEQARSQIQAAAQAVQFLMSQLEAAGIPIARVLGLTAKLAAIDTAFGELSGEVDDLSGTVSGLTFATFRPKVFTAANFNAEPWREYWCNGASGAVIGMLPAAPDIGVTTSVIREGANTVTVEGSGKTIAGRPEGLTIERVGYGADFTWTGATWRVEQRMIA